MIPHPLNPVPSPLAPRPDPADPLLNPPPLPGHAPQELPPRQPVDGPAGEGEPPLPSPGVPPNHPLGPPVPQP